MERDDEKIWAGYAQTMTDVATDATIKPTPMGWLIPDKSNFSRERRENSSEDYQHVTHLIQGTRNSDRGNTPPSESIAEQPSEVIDRFEDLDPTVDYEMSANFLNKAGDYLKQRITVGGFEVISGFEIPSGQMEIDWVQLPRDSYTDGTIDIKTSKIETAWPAMISQLREATYDPENPPVIQKKHTPRSRKRLPYCKTIRTRFDEVIYKKG